eukprot:jgi/Hompol1/5320/HPOL_000764-RA
MASGAGAAGASWFSKFINHPAVVMQDLTAPLSFYGIESGSKIMMLVDKRGTAAWQSTAAASQRTQQQQQQQQPDEPIATLSPEQHLIARLEEQIHFTKTTLAPMIEQYEANVAIFITQPASSTSQSILDTTTTTTTPLLTQKAMQDEYAKLSELLLQRLIKIDGVDCPAEFADARSHRREAVRFVQSKMDFVDSLKESVAKVIRDRSSL